jgi:multiple sugar transport system permease protein
MKTARGFFSIKFVFLLPAVIWILFFVIYPLGYALAMSFFEYRLGQGLTRFVYFNNYARMLTSESFWNSFKVTLIFVGAAVSIEMVLGTFMAWLLNNKLKLSGFFHTVFTAPIFTTVVAIGYLGVTMFHQTSGPINYFLGKELPWISDPFLALAAMLLLDIWRWTPFVFVILYAGFQGIPQNMYESAYLETKSDWKIFRFVLLPYLIPNLTIVLLLRMVRAFKVFGLAVSLTGGGPGTATEVYTLLAYRTSIKFFDFGNGSALAIIFLIFVMLVVTRLVGYMMKSWYS